jgi:CCR4-NOT transcriptional regulation complex NOT5 subunit
LEFIAVERAQGSVRSRSVGEFAETISFRTASFAIGDQSKTHNLASLRKQLRQVVLASPIRDVSNENRSFRAFGVVSWTTTAIASETATTSAAATASAITATAAASISTATASVATTTAAITATSSPETTAVSAAHVDGIILLMELRIANEKTRRYQSNLG